MHKLTTERSQNLSVRYKRTEKKKEEENSIHSLLRKYSKQILHPEEANSESS